MCPCSNSVNRTYKWMHIDRSRGTHADHRACIYKHIMFRHTGLATYLAPATVRLMQNTTRLGRWQLHQEVGPQQAKGPCAHKSCPDMWRWSGGHWRLAGWSPRKGGRAGVGWRETRHPCLFLLDFDLLPSKSIRLFFFLFIRFVSAVFARVVVIQIGVVVQKRAQIHMEYQVVCSYRNWSCFPRCQLTQTHVSCTCGSLSLCIITDRCRVTQWQHLHLYCVLWYALSVESSAYVRLWQNTD